MIVVHEMQFSWATSHSSLGHNWDLDGKTSAISAEAKCHFAIFGPAIETMVTVEALVEPVQLRQRPNVKFNFANIDSWENSIAKLGLLKDKEIYTRKGF